MLWSTVTAVVIASIWLETTTTAYIGLSIETVKTEEVWLSCSTNASSLEKKKTEVLQAYQEHAGEFYWVDSFDCFRWITIALGKSHLTSLKVRNCNMTPRLGFPFFLLVASIYSVKVTKTEALLFFLYSYIFYIKYVPSLRLWIVRLAVCTQREA